VGFFELDEEAAAAETARLPPSTPCAGAWTRHTASPCPQKASLLFSWKFSLE